ncbi:cation:proton antiporter domain-containing protein [Halapricum hydrolyticum]|uniref:NAD-binding protein n=1 Tax=Halapricum hydrolyticum TaxID=2979991 RepID=A0AAE3IBQ0_9EURY|nr:cation:proton antiporter [Halapricum hydrolyticum]MCU4718460.1 NAD-binding protein [Halapricum hydrolyticum]MCU4727521.1 NAD-binding protein [Halapricum hydrolyticum]
MSAGAATLIALVAGIIALGVLAQLLSARLQLPSIIFYIFAGLALGPAAELILGTRIISLSTFGGEETLSAVVGLAVAIIVFEGAFHLQIDRIREAPTASFRLVTVGAAIALVGTALAVHLVYPEVGWGISFLIGALLVATGPTVIAPILQVVPVRDRVAATLETEGIVNDVTAAILSVVVFKVIVIQGETPADIFTEFTARLGQGLLVGVIVAGVVYYLLRYVDLSPGDAPRNARLLVLAGALVAYAGADFLAGEAGVASAATAGFLLGNANVPYEEDIVDFKGDVTLLVLSFVFIILAALLELDALADVGLPGLLVVAAIALVIRPLLVLVSLAGDRFTVSEKLFVGFVGPRGIIPASVATLFAIQLQAQGAVHDANVLLGVVFLAILLTAVFEGGLARYIAEYLDVIPMRVIIVGGGRVGRALADRLEERGENVVLLERDETVVEQARNQGYTVEHGDGTDTDVLRSAGANAAKIVVAATGDDDANLLISQLASSKFDVENVIARANNPDNVEPFEELGVQTISSSLAIAWAIDNQIERPALSHWMTDLDRVGDVQEVELRNPALFDRPVLEIGPELPDSCLIALVYRDGEAVVPTADYTIHKGDRLTLLGRTEAVREGMALCRGETER